MGRRRDQFGRAAPGLKLQLVFGALLAKEAVTERRGPHVREMTRLMSKRTLLVPAMAGFAAALLMGAGPAGPGTAAASPPSFGAVTGSGIMREVQHISISINRKPAEVYEFASDPRNLPRWAAGLARSELEKDGKLSPKSAAAIREHNTPLALFAVSIAGELGGTLLFNVRLDDEDEHQRCAAVLLNQDQEDECVALVFLDKSGRSVHLENAEESSHPLAATAFNGRHSPAAPA